MLPWESDAYRAPLRPGADNDFTIDTVKD